MRRYSDHLGVHTPNINREHIYILPSIINVTMSTSPGKGLVSGGMPLQNAIPFADNCNATLPGFDGLAVCLTKSDM